MQITKKQNALISNGENYVRMGIGIIGLLLVK
jgi:hypothetical protein